MNKSASVNGLFENSTDQSNNLLKHMDNIASENPTLYNISPEVSSLPSKMKTIYEIIETIKLIIPYLDRDEIPLIKIKDKNILESGRIIGIESYLSSLTEFDDNKFEKCFKCKKNLNQYFCQNCNKNICGDICYNNCLSNNHILIDLQKELDKITYYMTKMKLIIEEHFILPKKKNVDDGIIKKTNNSFDENEDSKISENIIHYPCDIILIEIIIEKNYLNYFHYKNIEECFNYLNAKLNMGNNSIIEKNRTIIEENSKDNNDYILIKYKIRTGEKKIKIFGKKFLERYKNICKIIYGDKEYNLTEYFEINNPKIIILEIKLIGINNIEDTSCMFCGCHSLISLPIISNWNTYNIINMNKMFCDCYSLINLPDISKWNTNNVTDMSLIFYDCHSLISLPDISKWNTNNIEKINLIFYNCCKLISMPDISGWNTNKVTNMSGMFYNCSLLKSLPDISKWNTNNVTNMHGMFYNCSSLISLPDISKWNTSNANDMCEIFYNCSSLISLPDISKWDISNIKNMSSMFACCSSIISLPDISKWNTRNVKKMNLMFSYCLSLISLPDISKWNLNNSIDISGMFLNCSKLKTLPDLGKSNNN